MSKNRTTPWTFEEIVVDLRKEIFEVWNEEDQAKFFLTEWNGNRLDSMHHGLGTYIRNQYKLWEIPWEPEMKEYMGCMCDCSPYHPDNMSMTIIEEVWKRGPKQ